MSIRKKLAIALAAFLAAPMVFTTTASAQAGAGAACAGTQCGLGGQIRGQIGDGLPLPISIQPAQSGPFSGITIMTGPPTVMTGGGGTIPTGGLSPVGLGLGQPGQIKPTSMATIMQTTAMAQNRSLTLMSGVFGYDLPTVMSIGVFGFNPQVFAVQTDLDYDNPHPGTNGTGMTVPGHGGSVMFSAGGRPGPATVSFYFNATAMGNLSTNYGATQAATPMAGNPGGVGINGVARFQSTVNQFGGTSTGRTLGTAMVFFPENPTAAVAPCTGCNFFISVVVPGSTGVAGGTFGGVVSNPPFSTTMGLFSGTVAFNGTIVNVNPTPLPSGTFVGQQATSVGFPLTTGRLDLTVTDVAVGADTEMFKRTGIDARDSNGNGVVALVSGSLSARNISKGNANRTWITLEIPEPGAILAASAGMFALFGCHQLVRRRRS